MSKEYLYGMRLRGFSPGAQPMDGFLRRADTIKDSVYSSVLLKTYHDILTYSRELSDEEISDYELDYLGMRLISPQTSNSLLIMRKDDS